MQEPEDHLFPTGQCRILLQSGQSWSGTPLLLSTRVCVVQIGWRQWWHSQSCGWLVFPRLQHSHPSCGQIWGRDAEWACSEILISGKVKRRRAAAFQPPFTGWLKWTDTLHTIFIYIFPCIPRGCNDHFDDNCFLIFVQQVKQNLNEKLRYLAFCLKNEHKSKIQLATN